tara:strand:- start:172 stop:615 length:444 start_codon:yes stop_codon:yes gene_type:complete
MADIVLTGDTSGAITIAAPAVAGTNTLTLPASSGTLLTTTGDGSSLTNLPVSGLGVGQTLQNVKSSRTESVNYTNSTGRPIWVYITALVIINGNSITLYVDDVAIGKQSTSDYVSQYKTLTAIVPNGSTYRFEQTSTLNITYWSELR